MPDRSPDPADFVGRGAELKMLAERLDRVRQGAAATVLIGGDAGIGKSRLLSRFAADAREAGARVLTGACEEHFGDPMPYGPLLEILEDYSREFGTGDEAYRRLTGFFDRGDHISGPQQVFVNVRRMLEAVGEPLVLIIEDLHWADPSTLDLVRHLAQARAEGRRLLLVCSHRTAGPGPADPLGQLLASANFTRRVERAELGPFTLAEVRALLDDGLDPALIERCRKWSEGNPFYAEQLIASGALSSPESVQLSADLQSVLLARVNDLSADALRVLRAAAVAGRTVSRRLLRLVSKLEPDALGASVQECFNRQMLITGRDEDTYRFRHALLREAVYTATVRDIRVDLHTAMARALSGDASLSLAEGSAAAELALHWYQAGSWPEAFASAVRAGDEAMRTFAFTSAEVQFDRALTLWSRVADPGVPRVRLLVAAAEAARWSGGADRALNRIEAAIAEAGPDRPDLMERQATYLWETGRRQEAELVYRAAAGLLDGSPASAVKARVLAAVALAQLHAGKYAEGKETAEGALRVAIEAGARAEEGRARNVSGLAHGMLGNVGEGVERLNQAITIARAENHLEDLLRAYANLGLILETAGDLREAAEASQTGLAEARKLELGNTTQAMILANNAGVALVMLGEWDAAETILAEMLLDRSPAESVYPRLTLAEVKVARGDYDRARELLASIETVENGDPRFLGPLHTIRALLALGSGDLPEAGREVARGVAALHDGENSLERLRLCAVGLRCAADLARSDRKLAMQVGDQLAREGFEARPAESTPETDQLVRLCQAERQRLRGTGTALMWQQVAEGWDRLDRPYEAAYARLRQAAATGGTREPLLAAHREATRLGAEPLLADVVRLAREFRLDLADRPYGLTEAEFETLRLLYDGADAAGIARARGVSQRTSETQIRRVYQKMDVHSQAQAMAKARADNLFP